MQSVIFSREEHSDHVETAQGRFDDLRVSRPTLLFTFGGYNAGDALSDPSRYFRFARFRMAKKRWKHLSGWYEGKVTLPSGCLIIAGGGGLLDVSKKQNKLLDHLCRENQVILWGVGTNRPNQGEVSRQLDEDELNVKTFDLSKCLLAGIRDFEGEKRGDARSRDRYVPCASAMLTGLGKSYTTRRTVGVIDHAFLREDDPYLVASSIPRISMNLRRFSISRILRFIGESESIYTSSYHAAYWSLLMGRKVVVQAPTSSKFLKLQHPVSFASKSLESDLERAVTAPFPDFLENARKRNVEFHLEVEGALRSSGLAGT